MPGLVLNHGSWYARFRNGGHEVRRLIGRADICSKSEARRILDLWRFEDMNRRAGVLRPKLIGFSNFADLYLERMIPKLAESTARNYPARIAILKTAFSNRPLSMIRSDDLERLIQTLSSRGRRSRTINHYLFLLNHMMVKAEEWDYLSKRPWSRVPKLRVRDSRPRLCYSRDQIATARSILYARSFAHGAFFDLALWTGMRTGEINNLLWTDIDLNRSVITVIQKPGWTPKSGKPREIAISDHLRPVLVELESQYRGKLFKPLPGSPKLLQITGDLSPYVMPIRAGRTYWTNLFRRAGILTPHSARHTVASNLLMAGASLKDVAELLGHSNIQTTSNVYGHLSEEHKRQTISLLKF